MKDKIKRLCARIYNDYKCYNTTRCCDYLKDKKSVLHLYRLAKSMIAIALFVITLRMETDHEPAITR